jgi:ketosteroid isomerase-like protein
MLTVETSAVTMLSMSRSKRPRGGLLGAAVPAVALAVGTPACGHPAQPGPSTAPGVAVDQVRGPVRLNPYHAVVRRKVVRAFEGLSAHDPGPALALMADDVRYTFEGEHALGGTRVSRDGVGTWFARLFRLLPGQFVLREIDVEGWPWATRVVTCFEHYVEPPDGPPYWGAGVQLVRLRWGKATRIRTYVDTARLQQTLLAQAAQGVAEAVAAPILE